MKDKLIQHARTLHGNDIKPCNGWETFDECFTCMSDYGQHEEMVLWFNLPCGSTAMIKESHLN